MNRTRDMGEYYDDEEKRLIESFEASNASVVSHLTPGRREEIMRAVKATMNDEREKITLRVSRQDLMRLRARALEEGMPYQTLINSILHKAVSN